MSTGQTKGAQTAVNRLTREFPALNDRQRLAVEAYLKGHTKTASTLIAGYRQESSAAVFGNATVQAVLAASVDRFLTGELAPAAIHTISKLMHDERTPAGVRAQLATSVLDRAGYGPKRFDKPDASSKDIGQLSKDELQSEIDRLSREIEHRMVDVTPVSEPITSQELDMYE